MPLTPRDTFFWVKFDRDPQPIHIRGKSIVEIFEILERLMAERGDIFEWMIRDYGR